MFATQCLGPHTPFCHTFRSNRQEQHCWHVALLSAQVHPRGKFGLLRRRRIRAFPERFENEHELWVAPFPIIVTSNNINPPSHLRASIGGSLLGRRAAFFQRSELRQVGVLDSAVLVALNVLCSLPFLHH